MSPGDQVLLHLYGTSILANAVLLTISTLFYGLYLVLAVFSFLVLRKRLRTQKITSALLFVMLISSTLHWSTFFLDLTIGIRVPLVELPGNDLKEQFNKVIQHNIPIMLFQYAVLPIHLLLCNTILVAQLWPLLRKSTPEKTIVSFLLFLSLVLAVLSAIHPPGFAVAGSEDTLKGWGIAFIATSFLSNIVNTVLIVVRRRRLEYFSSGAILILLQFCLLVASTFTLTTLSTAEIFIRCFKQMAILITAAYPSFGIILGGLVVKDGGEQVEMGELSPAVGYVHLA